MGFYDHRSMPEKRLIKQKKTYAVWCATKENSKLVMGNIQPSTIRPFVCLQGVHGCSSACLFSVNPSADMWSTEVVGIGCLYYSKEFI